MTSDLDIYRTANVLIREHGEDARIEAAQRGDAMLEKGFSSALGRALIPTLRRPLNPSSAIASGCGAFLAKLEWRQEMGVIDMADKQPTIRPEIWLIAGGLVIGCAFLVLWLTTW